MQVQTASVWTLAEVAAGDKPTEVELVLPASAGY
jgi:hypothetical protein